MEISDQDIENMSLSYDDTSDKVKLEKKAMNYLKENNQQRY